MCAAFWFWGSTLALNTEFRTQEVPNYIAIAARIFHDPNLP
jgi:hypothetical protein